MCHGTAAAGTGPQTDGSACVFAAACVRLTGTDVTVYFVLLRARAQSHTPVGRRRVRFLMFNLVSYLLRKILKSSDQNEA